MTTNTQSGTRIDEIAEGIYRISTPVALDAIPGGFSFNQYLISDDEPVLFHSGLHKMFPLIHEAVSKVVPAEKLRWIGYSHFEGDESGALNDFLAVAPAAQPFSSQIGLLTSLNDVTDRPGRGLAEGEQFSTGRHRFEWIYTPHVPHGWDCGVLFDHTTRTLFCGDLFTQPGSNHPPVTESDIFASSESMRKLMDYFAHSVGTDKILNRLAVLKPGTLACMHGSAYRGDGAALLRELGATLMREDRESQAVPAAAHR
jgi:flavorubredoxin